MSQGDVTPNIEPPLRASCEACFYTWPVDDEDEAVPCPNCDSDDVTVEPDAR